MTCDGAQAAAGTAKGTRVKRRGRQDGTLMLSVNKASTCCLFTSFLSFLLRMARASRCRDSKLPAKASDDKPPSEEVACARHITERSLAPAGKEYRILRPKAVGHIVGVSVLQACGFQIRPEDPTVCVCIRGARGCDGIAARNQASVSLIAGPARCGGATAPHSHLMMMVFSTRV